MIVCITGATGFIGCRLVHYHISKGDEVRYLTRENKKKITGAKSFTGDIAGSVSNLAIFLKGASLLYHCAGEVSDESLMRRTHVHGTKNLLKAVEQARRDKQNAFHWIQLSSCGAYGQLSTRPIANRSVDEETAEEPSGEYETTKTESDHLVINYAKASSKFHYTVIRPSIVFGMGMRSTAIRRITNVIKKGFFFYVRDKKAIANYVHVDDVVHAMTLSANNRVAFNQTFIVANDCGYKEMVDAIANVLRVKRPNIVINEYLLRKILFVAGLFRQLPINQEHVDVMVRRTDYSNSKLKAALGWTPSAPITIQFANTVKDTLLLQPLLR